MHAIALVSTHTHIGLSPHRCPDTGTHTHTLANAYAESHALRARHMTIMLMATLYRNDCVRACVRMCAFVCTISICPISIYIPTHTQHANIFHVRPGTGGTRFHLFTIDYLVPTGIL